MLLWQGPSSGSFWAMCLQGELREVVDRHHMPRRPSLESPLSSLPSYGLHLSNQKAQIGVESEFCLSFSLARTFMGIYPFYVSHLS